MIVITIREDGLLEAMVDGSEPAPHIVVIHEGEQWTDSPVVEGTTEDAMVEWIAAHRNEGYEDRNP